MLKRVYKKILSKSLSPLFLNYNFNSGLKLKKLGSNYGGWVIPVNIVNKNFVCYLAGAGEDITFDCSLVELMKVNVFIFDPTPRAKIHYDLLKSNIKKGEKMSINSSKNSFYKIKKENLKFLKFFPYGIWNKDTQMKFYSPKNPLHVSHSLLNLQDTSEYFLAKCKKISSIMRELGHKKIDLLKIDIEGAEYKVLESLFKDKIFPKILCVEFDEVNNPLDYKFVFRIRKQIQTIKRKGYDLVFVEGKSDYTFVRKN